LLTVIIDFQTRSRLFHWRKLFLITAKKLVDPLMRSLPSNAARKRYVSDALAFGGIAFFGSSDGEVCRYSLLFVDNFVLC
jgi:hypothetical protein